MDYRTIGQKVTLEGALNPTSESAGPAALLSVIALRLTKYHVAQCNM